MNKSYSEMLMYDTYEERLKYLSLVGRVGADTFGHSRYLNQDFYRTREWKEVRDYIIMRDLGKDLAINHEDYDIYDMIIVHHINPITADDIINNNPCLYDPENLVCTSKSTHDAIHYGAKHKYSEVITRTKNDTCPWLQ